MRIEEFAGVLVVACADGWARSRPVEWWVRRSSGDGE